MPCHTAGSVHALSNIMPAHAGMQCAIRPAVGVCWGALVASKVTRSVCAGAKTQAHPESTVGVLTMSGKTPRVLVTPTPDLGKVLNCMTEVNVEGESNISASVQIAQLALKHRQNKNQRQRIVIFVGSPVTEDKVRLPL